MAGAVEEHIERARQLLTEAEAEYQRAWQERGLEVIIAWRNSYEKGCLAVLEACTAFFLKQGVPGNELPDPTPESDWEIQHLVGNLMADEHMLGTYYRLRSGYYDRLWDFEDMPRFYFEDIKEFIGLIEAATGQETSGE